MESSGAHHVHGRAAQRGGHDPVLQKPREPKIGDLQLDVLSRINVFSLPSRKMLFRFQKTNLRSWVLGAAVVVEQDVLGLQVAVDDVLRHHRPNGASCKIKETSWVSNMDGDGAIIYHDYRHF